MSALAEAVHPQENRDSLTLAAALGRIDEQVFRKNSGAAFARPERFQRNRHGRPFETQIAHVPWSYLC